MAEPTEIPMMKPRILLIEDDDISRRFLADAVMQLDVELTTCSDFTEAVAFLQTNVPTLIISDLNLPDGDLFGRVADFPSDVPILALSAEVSLPIRERLSAVGIHSVLAKPMPVAVLLEAINPFCKPAAALWNANSALKAVGGNRNALLRLQAMFLAELPLAADGIRNAFDAGNLKLMQDALHKLKGSCGFLGAEQLLVACHALDRNPDRIYMDAFQASVAATIALIRASGD